MEGLVKEELNVKHLEYIDNPDEYVSYTVKPNFPVLGPKYGKQLQGIATGLAKSDATATASLVKTLRENGAVQIEVTGTPVTLTNEDLEIRVQDKEGFAVEMSHGQYVVLDITLTDELIAEGLAREIVSKVQNMRKNAGLELTDRIRLEFVVDDEVTAAMERFRDYIQSETLSVSVERKTSAGESFEQWEINGHQAHLRISKQ